MLVLPESTKPDLNRSATRTGRKRASRARRGAVTVEFALVCPILFAFIFAGVEFSRVNMIRNSITNAAYEGARCGILPGATNAECVAAAEGYLDILGIETSTVTVTPTDLSTATSVSVDIAVAMDGSNGYVMPNIFLNKIVDSSITLTRE